MFLHLGQDVMVPLEDVVSIVNLAGVGTSDNELLVKTATEQGFVIQLSEDPISCIVTNFPYLSFSHICPNTAEKGLTKVLVESRLNLFVR